MLAGLGGKVNLTMRSLISLFHHRTSVLRHCSVCVVRRLSRKSFSGSLVFCLTDILTVTIECSSEHVVSILPSLVVITFLENLELSGNLTAVVEMLVRECQGNVSE